MIHRIHSLSNGIKANQKSRIKIEKKKKMKRTNLLTWHRIIWLFIKSSRKYRSTVLKWSKAIKEPRKPIIYVLFALCFSPISLSYILWISSTLNHLPFVNIWTKNINMDYVVGYIVVFSIHESMRYPKNDNKSTLQQNRFGRNTYIHTHTPLWISTTGYVLTKRFTFNNNIDKAKPLNSVWREIFKPFN